METKDILKKVDMLNIDPRFNLIVASYFCAKVKLGEITEETLDKELAQFKQKVQHFEVIKTSKFKVAYEEKGGIITLSKDFLSQDNAEEMVPLIFMKIEEALNIQRDNQGELDHQKNALLHMKSFQKAMQLVQELNLPCNNNYIDIYHILTETLGVDGQALDIEISKDRGLEIMCGDTDEAFNKVVARGEKEPKVISEILNLYRYRVLTDQENGIDITSAKYQESLKKVGRYIQSLHDNNYANINQCKGNIEKLAQVTGLAEEMTHEIRTNSADEEKSEDRSNARLLSGIMVRATSEPEKLTEKYIKERVSRLIEAKPDYDTRLSCLLPEFFLRSAIIYGWSKDDFEQRINSVDSTIQKIGFKELDIYTGGDTALGEIRVNSRFYLNSKGRINNDSFLGLARTFFHEAGHTTDKSVREGVAVQEMLATANVDNIFYEWSNTIFERAIMGNMYEDENAMFLEQNAGYETVANAGSMISAALGMNEIEFARLKDVGLEQTKEFFDSKFSYYPGLYEKIKSTFMISSLRTEGRESRKRIQQMYKNVYDLCIDILDVRIENDTQQGRIENISEYEEKQRYFLKKINLNYQTASKRYGLRRDAGKVVHKTKHTTDEIDRKAMRKIGAEVRSESDFGFENDVLLEKLKSSERKPTLREWLNRRFGRVPLLEEGRQNSSLEVTTPNIEADVEKGLND